MNFRFVWKRTYALLRNPDKVWNNVVTETTQYTKHFKYFALPSMIAVTTAALVGLLLYWPVFDYSIVYILVRTICTFLIYYFTLFVSIRIIHETKTYFHTTEDRNIISILLMYSLAPFFLGSVLANLLYNYYALGSFLKCCGFYGMYIFYKGSYRISGINDNLRNKYMYTATIVVTIVYLLLHWSLSHLWKALFYYNMIK